MSFKFSRTSQARLSAVDSTLRKIAERALELSPIDFGIPEHGGYRTEEVQAMLFARGVSKCDGTAKKSYHQSGKALDFYAFVNGKESWEPAHLAMVAAAFFQAAGEFGVALRWGGLFTPFKEFDSCDYECGWDAGHIEMP